MLKNFQIILTFICLGFSYTGSVVVDYPNKGLPITHSAFEKSTYLRSGLYLPSDEAALKLIASTTTALSIARNSSDRETVIGILELIIAKIEDYKPSSEEGFIAVMKLHDDFRKILLEYEDYDLIERLSETNYLKAKAFSDWPRALAQAAYNRGASAIDRNNFTTSVSYLREAIGNLSIEVPEHRSLLALSHNDLAYSYDWLGFTSLPLEHYLTALDIYETYLPEEFNNTLTVIGNITSIYGSYGDRKQVKFYLDRMEVLISSMYESGRMTEQELVAAKVSLYSKKIGYYSDIFDEEMAFTELAALESFLDGLPNANSGIFLANRLSSIENVGYMFKQLKKFDRAIATYKRMDLFEIGDFFRMKRNANIAIALFDSGAYAQALPYSNQALEFYKSNQFGTGEFTLSVLKSKLLLETGKHQEALDQLLAAYAKFLGVAPTAEALSRLELEVFEGRFNGRYLDVLIKSAEIMDDFYRINSFEIYSEASFRLYYIAARMFEAYYQKEAYNPDLERYEKQIKQGLLGHLSAPIISSSIAPREIINLLENNRSQQLWKRFLNKNERNLEANRDLLQQSNMLIARITEAKEREDAVEEQALTEELQKIENELEGRFAGYSFHKQSDFDIIDLQSKLNPSEMLIKFYEASGDFFCLTLTPDQFSFSRVGRVENINEILHQFLLQTQSIGINTDESTKALYSLLLGKRLRADKPKLTILAEGKLAYLPFEALKNEAGSFLIEKYSVSYAYALNLLAFSRSEKPNFKGDFLLALSPDYTRTNYTLIKNNLQEAASISKVMGGTLLTGNQASKENFLKEVTKFRIFHLAMHAEQDEMNYERSALVFSGGEKLYFHELYEFHFPADLVVLSACNTGIGSLEPGQGLMSLGTALRYAGVRSSVHSLWQIPDQETARLMELFYANLIKGKDKDEALRAAKLDFIKENPLQSHPYFWAGFVLTGDTAPITEESSNSLLYFLLLLAFLPFLIRLRNKRKFS
jgi:CHAT domain-containing protein